MFGNGDRADLDMEEMGVTTDRLSVLREEVGITDVLHLDSRPTKRKARNIGIYNRVTAEEREAKYQYIFSALLINTCLLAQVVFASALTALGAGNGSHTQITILGAANTVIAAVLTFTKGQGLPNRLRQYQCSMRKIREYIEQRERDFAQLDCKLRIDEEVQVIKQLYLEARQNDENNDPSTYHDAAALTVQNKPPASNGMQDRSEPRNQPVYRSKLSPPPPPIANPSSRRDESKEDDVVPAKSESVDTQVRPFFVGHAEACLRLTNSRPQTSL